MSGPRSVLRQYFLLLLLALCWEVPLTAQRTIHVPADEPTVQAGIDAAAAGDTVLIAAGEYYENIDFKGKAITVTGTGNLTATVIQGGARGPAVSFVSGEGRNSILSNLTVEGGGSSTAATQAGIYVNGGSPTIRGDQIFGGMCHGIYVVAGAPLIDTSQVVGTVGDNSNTGCTVANGTAIFLDGGHPGTVTVIQNNFIGTNYTAVSVPGAESGGAGIFARNGASVLIQRNTISGNGAAASGAKGGGILIEGASATIFNNLISDNVAGQSGGGIAVLDGSVPSGTIQIVNNTVAYNRVIAAPNFLGIPSAGVEVDVEGGSPVALNNNIILENNQRSAVTCSGINTLVSFQNNAIYNSVGPSTADVAQGECRYQVGTNGNTNEDPMVLKAGLYQFRLAVGSPAIDAGSNAALQAVALVPGADISTDLDGNPRVVNALTKPAAIVDIGAYEFQNANAPTSFTLASSLNPSNLGQTVTFTATVALASGPAVGTITFEDATTPLGTVPLANGVAILTTATLTAGTHGITAVFTPANGVGGTTTTLTQIVNGQPTATSLTVTPNPGYAFNTVLLTGRVTSSAGTPGGTLVFKAGSQVLATAPVRADGTAAATTSALGGGTYSIIATYSGDNTFTASTSTPVSLVLAALADAIAGSATPNPAFEGQTVTLAASVHFPAGTAAPTGTLSFSDGGVPLGSARLDTTGSATLGTAGILLGNRTITVVYSGDVNYLPATTTLQVFVTLIPSNTSLTDSPNPSYLGQSITLTAAVSAAGTAVDGLVTFYDGPTPLVTVPTSAGTARFAISTLTAGQHTLTAAYRGALTDAVSVSAPMTQTVLAAGFTLDLSPGVITLKTGATGSTLARITSLGNFAGPLQLSFGTLPLHSTGGFSASSVSLAPAGTAPVTFSISTVDYTTVLRSQLSPSGTNRNLTLALLSLPLLLWKRHRSKALLLAVSTFFLVSGTVGCTDIRYPFATVTPGLYSVPVTATDRNSVSHTALLQVKVTE